MRNTRIVQIGGTVGLSAAAAVVAHAGPAGLAERRWLIVAALGAAVALGALLLALRLVLVLEERARRVRAGDHGLGRPPVPDDIPFSTLVGAMLLCQGCAHYALLAAGVPAHDGPAGSLTLHLLLALAAAAIVTAAVRTVRRAAESLESAIADALALLMARRPGQRAPMSSRHRRVRELAGGVRGRAPPVVVLPS